MPYPVSGIFSPTASTQHPECLSFHGIKICTLCSNRSFFTCLVRTWSWVAQTPEARDVVPVTSLFTHSHFITQILFSSGCRWVKTWCKRPVCHKSSRWTFRGSKVGTVCSSSTLVRALLPVLPASLAACPRVRGLRSTLALQRPHTVYIPICLCPLF